MEVKPQNRTKASLQENRFKMGSRFFFLMFGSTFIGLLTKFLYPAFAVPPLAGRRGFAEAWRVPSRRPRRDRTTGSPAVGGVKSPWAPQKISYD